MNTNTGRTAVPEARAALDQFKYEVASEIGVPLKQGYNGDLTSAQNGSVGGYMVNIICPARTQNYTRQRRNIGGYKQTIQYIYHIGT